MMALPESVTFAGLNTVHQGPHKCNGYPRGVASKIALQDITRWGNAQKGPYGRY